MLTDISADNAVFFKSQVTFPCVHDPSDEGDVVSRVSTKGIDAVEGQGPSVSALPPFGQAKSPARVGAQARLGPPGFLQPSHREIKVFRESLLVSASRCSKEGAQSVMERVGVPPFCPVLLSSGGETLSAAKLSPKRLDGANLARRTQPLLSWQELQSEPVGLGLHLLSRELQAVRENSRTPVRPELPEKGCVFFVPRLPEQSCSCVQLVLSYAEVTEKSRSFPRGVLGKTTRIRTSTLTSVRSSPFLQEKRVGHKPCHGDIIARWVNDNA